MKFSANKDFGQHFLIDKNIISKITEDFKEKAEGIFEIGPGPAVLTKNLNNHGKPFFAIEVDKKFIPFLEEEIGKDKILHQDALKVDLKSEIQQRFSGLKEIWCVSNLPYNISAPLIVKLIHTSEIRFMTLMMQKEVADKIVPLEKKNTMSSLFALTQTFFSVKRLVAVPPGAFNPPPQVKSTVLSFEKRRHDDIPTEILENPLKFEKFLRVLFRERRKQLGSVLKKSYDAERLTEVFTKTGIDTKRRSETLSLPDVFSLFHNLR